jgi:hypothetical protein
MDTTCLAHDVMQVCRNGHVITDRLRTCSDQALGHCDRCGALTLDRCRTCGQEIAGAPLDPLPVPIGRARPPQYCSRCGAAFPWARQPRPDPNATPLGRLEALLRRVPPVARQLRGRQGDRPPFRVADDHDLEDLVRALLAIPFDDVRPESRTPRYAAGTRTDFVLRAGAIALTVKRVGPGFRDAALVRQFEEDVAHYQGRPDCRTLVLFVHDPEGLVADPAALETAWSGPHDDLDVRCVVA